LLRDVQWDSLGVEVLHVDLTRVSADELVEVEIAVELRGEAPGTKEGGVIEHHTHEVTIQCPAAAIPESLVVSLNQLQLGATITAADLKLPDRASLVTGADTLIVQCVLPVVRAEAAVAAAEAAEPEVIGRPAEGGEESSGE
jgi:large subunit ribosomal protein L25